MSLLLSGDLRLAKSYTPYPLLLSGVVAWWDADDASTFTFSSGTVVEEWRSRVGSYALIQANPANRPSRSGAVNGKSTVVFDGSNDSLSVANFDLTAGGQAFSLWAVVTAASGTDQAVVEHTTNFNNNAGAFLFARNAAGNSPGLGKRGSTAYATFENTTSVTTPAAIIVGTHDGTLATNETTLWVNGNANGARFVNSNTNSSNLNSTLFVGARAGTSLFLNGQIAELGITTNAMTDSDRLLLQQYLAAKWGTP